MSKSKPVITGSIQKIRRSQNQSPEIIYFRVGSQDPPEVKDCEMKAGEIHDYLELGNIVEVYGRIDEKTGIVHAKKVVDTQSLSVTTPVSYWRSCLLWFFVIAVIVIIVLYMISTWLH